MLGPPGFHHQWCQPLRISGIDIDPQDPLAWIRRGQPVDALLIYSQAGPSHPLVEVDSRHDQGHARPYGNQPQGFGSLAFTPRPFFLGLLMFGPHVPVDCLDFLVGNQGGHLLHHFHIDGRFSRLLFLFVDILFPPEHPGADFRLYFFLQPGADQLVFLPATGCFDVFKAGAHLPVDFLDFFVRNNVGHFLHRFYVDGRIAGALGLPFDRFFPLEHSGTDFRLDFFFQLIFA